MSDPVKNRYEFMILFDVENGNPNGDPDAYNMPRQDPEDGHGLVTDTCLKHKIRRYIDSRMTDIPGYRIYIKNDMPLERKDLGAYLYKDIDVKNIKAARKDNPDLDRELRNWMCQNYWDIRAFGAVMTTFVKNGHNCGQLAGPIQLGFSRSIDPIMPQEIVMTRQAVTTEADAAAQKRGTMGCKYIVPYGLYCCKGYVNAELACRHTGFSEEDLDLLWEAILNMFELDRSASRGNMAVQELIIFKHDSIHGAPNAHAHKLFDTVEIRRKPEVTVPRKYRDYTVTVDETALPAGVTCIRMN